MTRGSGPPQAALDHLLYVVPDLETGVAEIERLLGVRPAEGGRHPQWATRNFLLSLGPERYLEIMGPDPSATPPPRGRLFGIDTLERGGLMAWCARSADLERTASAAATAGLPAGEVSRGQRTRPDGSVVAWTLTDPYVRHLDGLCPFFIDWGDTPHPGGSAPPGVRLRAFHLEHPEPDRIRQALRGLGLEVEVRPAGRPALVAALDAPAGAVELRT